MGVGVREMKKGCMRLAYRREIRSQETEFCVCKRERYFKTRVIDRETYEGTQDISRGRECV